MLQVGWERRVVSLSVRIRDQSKLLKSAVVCKQNIACLPVSFCTHTLPHCTKTGDGERHDLLHS